MLGSPATAADPRFARNSARVEHSDDLREVIESTFAGTTAEQAAVALENAGIANALLRDMAGLADHPQLAARDRWRDYESPVGTLRALVPPATFVGSEPVMGPVPGIGEHTDAVLEEFGILAAPGIRQ